MTKYICECDKGKTHRCTHDLDGRAKVEDQKTEHPDQIQEGAWVYVLPDNIEPFYGKVYSLYLGGQGVWVKLNGRFVIAAFSMDRVRPARLRAWNDDELKSKVGKVFEMGNGDLTLCLGYQRDRGALHFAGKGPFSYSAKILAKSDWKLDGSPCGVLEHYEQGKWVK